MNFQELMKKMVELDQAVTEEKQVGEVAGAQKCWPGHRKVGTKPGTGKNAGKRVNDCEKIKEDEEVTEECGMPPSMADAPKQQDSVTMSVNMNGSGSGGIADLMAILRKIENSEPTSGDEMDVLVKKLPGFDNFVGGEQFANEPDEVYKNVDSVVNPPSNGLNKPTQSYPAAAGGDNPMNIKPRLESLYNDIKLRESGLQYHTGVKKHGKEYMAKAAAAGRNGASQKELGALKDKYSKAYKEDGVGEATGDKPFDNMMKTIKKGTARQATADRREQRRQSQQQARDAFGTSPAASLGIRKKLDMPEAAKKGLYYNVNKRKAAGTSRPASSSKAPTAQAWKDAAKTAKK